MHEYYIFIESYYMKAALLLTLGALGLTLSK